MTDYQNFDHDAYARSKNKDDFWGQIRRTVNGTPVDQNQIDLIVLAIKQRLGLKEHDYLLDLACGNGALSSLLSNYCKKLHGVDLSEFLITVAKENFASSKLTFTCNDVVDYLSKVKNPDLFNKVLCYGSFSYLSEDAACEFLRLIYQRFSNVSRVFLGNLPDLNLKDLFFTKSVPSNSDLICNTTSIGIWRTESEFIGIAKNAGWVVDVSRMQGKFYASNYRYDVLLRRV